MSMLETGSEVKLAGIDLAWHGSRPSGLALGRLSQHRLVVDVLSSDVFSNDALCRQLEEFQVVGIAIDAPLIVTNQSGMRDCEKQIGKLYGAKRASCHTANLTLFPQALSVQLSQDLQQRNYQHITGKHWQIEVYPHPAIIELFELDYRLAYKKGNIAERKAGQLLLATYLVGLDNRLPFKLNLPSNLSVALTKHEIDQLKGEQLKHNEDKLDALECLVVAALHSLIQTQVIGDAQTGYIVVPMIQSAKHG